MKLEKFVLAGHSFGGYISGFYTLRHTQYVKKLLLLSPVGIRPGDPNENPEEENLDEKFKSM